jgi:transposase
MSLHPGKMGEVPEETARVAKACFPKGNRYMRLRDTLGTIFEDHEFADLFPRRGKPAEAPWRLALVCLVQYMEELTDRQAADAVRSRMDIKYLLGLELTDPGFDFSVLSEFRSRLVEHQAEHRLFELLVAKLSEQGYLKKRGTQRTDSTHVSLRSASIPSGRTAPGNAASCPQ